MDDPLYQLNRLTIKYTDFRSIGKVGSMNLYEDIPFIIRQVMHLTFVALPEGRLCSLLTSRRRTLGYIWLQDGTVSSQGCHRLEGPSVQA